jgi:hypothetical protein
MVELYFEGLSSKLNDALSSSGISFVKKPVSKVNVDELREEVARAREAHNRAKGVGNTFGSGISPSLNSISNSSFSSSSFGNLSSSTSYPGTSYSGQRSDVQSNVVQGTRRKVRLSKKDDLSDNNTGNNNTGNQMSDTQSSSNYYDKYFDNITKKSSNGPVNESDISGSKSTVSKSLTNGNENSLENSMKKTNIKKSPENLLHEESQYKISQLTDRISNLKKRVYSLENTDSGKSRLLLIKLKYADSNISLLQKHYIEDYYNKTLVKLDEIEQEVNIYEHVLKTRIIVKGYLSRGVSKSDISDKLISQGWSQDHVDDIFRGL